MCPSSGQAWGAFPHNLRAHLPLPAVSYVAPQGFSATLNAIVANIPRARQTLLFSATQTKSVKDLARLSLKVQRGSAWQHARTGPRCAAYRCCHGGALALPALGGPLPPVPAGFWQCRHFGTQIRLVQNRSGSKLNHLPLPPHPLLRQDPEYISVHAEASTPTPLKLQQVGQRLRGCSCPAYWGYKLCCRPFTKSRG